MIIIQDWKFKSFKIYELVNIFDQFSKINEILQNLMTPWQENIVA